MATTEEIIAGQLRERIDGMRSYIEKAEDMLAELDYLQCAVRLEKAAELGTFDPFVMTVFDSMSK